MCSIIGSMGTAAPMTIDQPANHDGRRLAVAASVFGLDLEQNPQLFRFTRQHHKVAALFGDIVLHDLTNRPDRIDDRRPSRVGHEHRQWLQRSASVSIGRQRKRERF